MSIILRIEGYNSTVGNDKYTYILVLSDLQQIHHLTSSIFDTLISSKLNIKLNTVLGCWVRRSVAVDEIGRVVSGCWDRRISSNDD